jgi:acetoin utilization deacetylase AcuC-like enzyme
MKLTLAGLAARDQQVFALGRQHQIPIAVAMAGGYGKKIEDTIAVHVQTIAIAAQYVLNVA